MGSDSGGDSPAGVSYDDLLNIRPSLRDVHEVLQGHAPEPLTTKEVADAADCERRTAYNRLTELKDAGGPIATKGIGKGRSGTPHIRIWWYSDVTVNTGGDTE